MNKTVELDISHISETDIAIIGMAGRFPGAKNIEEFWQNIINAKDSISHFSDDQLRKAGVEESLIQNPHYVKAAGILDEIDLFDANFFGMTPHEASIMDPQHRLFLEVCWEALEVAEYAHREIDMSIGVFAGMSDSTYLQNFLLKNKEFLSSSHPYQTHIATSGNFLATKVAYHLNLTGPSININTACSTSLVTVITACQSLLTGECDMAIAGGISLRVPQVQGYWYQEGGILSKDGKCRAFDADATGTVSSSGAGVVVLKRLRDALKDKDTIDAVIKGYAINNDGAKKVSYTAPSMVEQSRCIASALTGIDAESIGYVEAHGTGTALGDPIEIAALTKAFEHYTSKKNYCAVGSVKTNIGHANTAAGIAGLIKTVLVLKNGIIPPTLYFQKANPHINFTDSPFYVNNSLLDWKKNDLPRRAGVSSLGIGGTNAHMVLEEGGAYRTDRSCRRISLPIHTFKKKRYWIDPDTSIEKNTVAIHPETDISRCFYQTSWSRLGLLSALQTINVSECSSRCWLIFAQNDALSRYLIKKLRSLGADVLCIYAGISFEQLTPYEYSINPKEGGHYAQLFALVSEKVDKEYQVIHLWNRDGKIADATVNTISETLYPSLYSLTFLVQAFGNLNVANMLNILWLNDHVQSVFSEETVCPTKATLLGACQVIPLEYNTIKIANVDVTKSKNKVSGKELVHYLITQALAISNQTKTRQLAYRQGYCWEKSFQAVSLTEEPKIPAILKNISVFKNQGVYLITGGLGGIGLSIAKQLAALTSAHIVLIARTALPDPQEWEAWLSKHTSAHSHYDAIHTLVSLRAQGKSFSVYAADVASYEQMEAVLISIEEKIGTVNGIIHAAGLPGSGLMQQKSLEDIDKILRPKLLGTYVLGQLFKTRSLDFIVLFSSLTALTGSIGQLDYAAANASLDAFPYSTFFNATTAVTTIHWNAWLASGMFARAAKTAQDLGRDTDALNKNNTVSLEEGISCLVFSLKKKMKNSIISRFVPDIIIEHKIKNNVSSKTSKHAIKEDKVQKEKSLEKKIVSIFQEILGIEKINVNDDFFCLGGDSLSAIGLMDVLEKKYGVRLSLNQIYEVRTASQLADFIKTSSCRELESPLVLLNPEGSTPALFLVHPVGGTIFCYITLSNTLKNQKMYAIQDPGLIQSGHSFDTLETMASYYLFEIQKIQPKGPYCIGGYSMGGTIAFEIAHQLLKKGEKVNFLGLVDSWVIFTDQFSDKEFFYKKMRHHLQDTERNLKSFLGDRVDDWLTSQWQRMQLLLQYTPSILEGKITLFKASTLLPEYAVIDDSCNHWQRYSTYPVDTHYISGDHDTVFSASNISLLSRRLSSCLNWLKK